MGVSDVGILTLNKLQLFVTATCLCPNPLSKAKQSKTIPFYKTTAFSITLGNLYRPPRDNLDNYTQFRDQFNVVLQQLRGEVVIGGDFNIDLLKIFEKPIFN